KFLRPRKPRLDHHGSTCIDVSPTPVAFEPRQPLGESPYLVKAKWNDYLASAVDEAGSVVVHHREKFIWSRHTDRLSCVVRRHAYLISEGMLGYECAVRHSLSPGTASVIGL